MKAFNPVRVFLVLAVVLCAESVQALSLWDDRVRVNGYLKTQFGVWLEDQSPYGMGDNAINMLRGTLQIETDVKLTDWAKLYCVFRGVREASYEAEVGVPDGFYDEEDIREIFLDVDVGEDLHLRIGRQQVVWGEADYQLILDIINPVDMSWHFMLEPWEDLRIPNYMLHSFYRLPFLKSSLELIWIPGLDDREDRVNKLPPSVTAIGRWTPHPTNISMDLPIPIPLRQNINYKYPNRSLEDSNIGLRYMFSLGDFEFAIMDYYTFSYAPLPVLKPIALPNDLGGILDLLVNGITIDLDMEYPRLNVTGASMNYYWDWVGAVLRLDFAYYWDQPYTAKQLTDMMGTQSINYFTIEESDTIKYLVGVDRPSMIRWLNKTTSFMIMGQFIQTILLDHKDNMVVTGFDAPIDKIQTFLNFGVTTSYFHAKIAPTVGGMYDFTGGWLIQNSLEYKPDNNWRINLKSNHIWGHSDFDSVGLFRGKDEFILELIFQW